MTKAGIVLDFDKKEEELHIQGHKHEGSQSEFESKSIAELKDMLNAAIANEDYEKAALIKNAIEARK